MTLSIATEQLAVRYGSTTAVEDLSISLGGGKIYGLLGRNGSGKTSMLQVLAGFRKAQGGHVLIDGQPVFDNPAVASQTCFIRESCDTVEHDFPQDRIKDALAFAAATRPNWDGGYAETLVEKFKLVKKKRISQLSRGQRSALGIILGLASRAPVTIFDESYLGMDAPSRYVFYDELLADFTEHPRTIVVSTHLIEEVNALFEEVVIIDEGRLVIHEEADVLRARGTTLVGPSDVVDQVAAGLTVLGEKRLGSTKSVTVYGELDDALVTAARGAGLELGPVPLQDLFVHLTGGS